MKILLNLSFILLAYVASAGIEQLPTGYYIVSDSVNHKLKSTEGKITFKVQNVDFYNPNFRVVIKTSVNGVWKDVKLDEFGIFSYDLEPGKCSFKFYVNNAFEELSINQLNLLPQHDMFVDLNFRTIYDIYNNTIEVDKPVIYLSSETPVDFKLNVKPNGKFTFTYPEINSGWNGTCDVSGQIQMNGKQYPYLFWESSQTYSFKPTTNGYRVSKENVSSFLEKKCDELGFNANEKTDFITYWGPRMVQFDELFVQFHVNEECNQFAEMEITPQPQHINRVYIAIADWNSSFESFVSEKSLSPIARGGFTLVEWGGFQFDIKSLEVSNK